MAGTAEPAPNQSSGLDLERHEQHPKNKNRTPYQQEVYEHAAKLYGQGFSRSKVARIMIDHLVPHGKDRPEEQRLSQARAKLRRWETSQEFRDLIYHRAVVQLDLETPEILQGVAKKAKRGRVDAARLTLELTGRHNPKGEQTPAQVVVAINGIPRPTSRSEVRDLEIEGEVVDESG